METVEHRATQSLVDASQTESADSGSLKQISARTLIEQLVRKQFTGRLLLSFNEKRKRSGSIRERSFEFSRIWPLNLLATR